MNSLKEEPIFVECPWCNCYFEIVGLNCGIFRHAQYFDGSFVDPHADKITCENLKNKVYGCLNPVKVVLKDGKFNTEKCDYV